MPITEDWYPDSLQERVDWHINLDTQAGAFKEKYGWDGTTLAWIHADRLWIEYWYNRKVGVELREKEMTAYIAAISGNKKDADVPQTPDFSADAPPAEVPPGIEARTRDLRRETVGRSFYSKADGLALGFEKPASEGLNLSEYAAHIDRMNQLSGYRLGAFFAKKGVDAYRFEGRFKGGEWFHISDESESGAILQLPAQEGGASAQIDIRAIGMKKYKPVGHYSDTKTMTIAP
jgi:hypothetical protein